MIFPIVLGLVAAGLSLMALQKANAAPIIPEGGGDNYTYVPAIPTADDILSSGSFSKLNAYYDYIGELYITGVIDLDTYNYLYQAYSDRWSELAGV